MNGLSILIISICLGVLCVAGVKSIIIDIKDAIQNRKIKVLLENDFELYLKAEQLKQEILERIAN